MKSIYKFIIGFMLMFGVTIASADEMKASTFEDAKDRLFEVAMISYTLTESMVESMTISNIACQLSYEIVVKQQEYVKNMRNQIFETTGISYEVYQNFKANKEEARQRFNVNPIK